MRSSFCSDFFSTFFTEGNLHENSLLFFESLSDFPAYFQLPAPSAPEMILPCGAAE